MPGRRETLISGQIYHVYNKTIDSKKVFTVENYCRLMIALLRYYRTNKLLPSFSHFQHMADSKTKEVLVEILNTKKYHKVEVLTYCLMPNHYHLLIKQKTDGGISKYMSDVLNALTRHINTKSNRKGPLFLPRFQSKRVVSQDQLNHVSRYIHLNPYSSKLVMNKNQLINYPWSSFSKYLSESKDNLCNTAIILSEFNDNRGEYKEFVLENADHQRELEYIKKLL